MSAKKSSSTKGWLAICAGLALTAGLGGCVDYVERRDTVTLGAGDAQAWNKTVHIADPWPAHAMNTQIPGDGRRTSVVIQRYSTGNSTGNADAGSAQTSAPAGSAGAAGSAGN